MLSLLLYRFIVFYGLYVVNVSMHFTTYYSPKTMKLRQLATTGNYAEDERGSPQPGYTYPPLQPTTASHPPLTTQLHWLEDSSALITISSDLGIRSYIPPVSLMDLQIDPLRPYSRSFLPSYTSCAIHPLSSLYGSTIPIVVAGHDVPMKLYDASPNATGKLTTLRAYSTMHPQTERYDKISSLAFQDENILCGGVKSIKVFDIERSTPIAELESLGIVSAITPTLDGWFSGTWNGIVNCVSDGKIAMETRIKEGVFQLLESDNGKYLYAIPRSSDCIRILDIRMGLDQVCALPFCSSSQRLTGCVKSKSQGLVIGSADGRLNWYKDSEMAMDTHEMEQLVDPVSHVQSHPQEDSILAYSTGDRSSLAPQISLSWLD